MCLEGTAYREHSRIDGVVRDGKGYVALLHQARQFPMYWLYTGVGMQQVQYTPHTPAEHVT